MGTFKEINQALRQIHMKTRGKMVAEVTRQKVEFSPLEHKAMNDIREFGIASQQMLVESMHRDKAQIARIIASLHRQDLIIKQASKSDKRAVQLTLSHRGSELLKRLDDVEMGMIDEMLTGFTAAESEQLGQLLQRISRNIS